MAAKKFLTAETAETAEKKKLRTLGDDSAVKRRIFHTLLRPANASSCFPRLDCREPRLVAQPQCRSRPVGGTPIDLLAYDHLQNECVAGVGRQRFDRPAADV